MDTLLAHGSHALLAAIEAALGRGIERDRAAEGVTYAIRGGYARAFDALPSSARACVVTQEFGTYSPLRVLHALREENRAHHYTGADPSHPAKQHLKAMFSPESPRWRRTVVERGLALAAAVARAAFDSA